MKIFDARSKYVKDFVSGKSYFKIAGVDIGSKYVGLALTDESRNFVSPLKYDITRKPGINFNYTFTRGLNNIITSNGVRMFIIGLPVYNGQLTPFCSEIIDLVSKADTPEDTFCCFWDETNTTMHARSITRLFSRRPSVISKQKDGLAAAVILNSFLSYVRT